MEEAIYSDRIFVMDEGKIVMQGTPKEIFSRPDELTKHRLTLPMATQVAYRLKEEGIPLPDGILNRKELARELIKIKEAK